MTTQRANPLQDPRIQAAIAELVRMIESRYPSATFDISLGEDNPEAIHVTATVDVDDPDEVVDLIIDRMLHIQLDDGLPVYVIPVRTPERVAALHQEQQARMHDTIVPPSSYR